MHQDRVVSTTKKRGATTIIINTDKRAMAAATARSPPLRTSASGGGWKAQHAPPVCKPPARRGRRDANAPPTDLFGAIKLQRRLLETRLRQLLLRRAQAVLICGRQRGRGRSLGERKARMVSNAAVCGPAEAGGMT